MAGNPVKIWTVGHSTRSSDEFIDLISHYGIRALADVRRFPGSKKFPHFNASELRDSLQAAGIEYVPIPELGGRRRANPNSVNTAWRNESFRGYADYMETVQFRSAIETLEKLAAEKPTAVMCAEVLWWRCHRALIADHFKANGAAVCHIFSKEKSEVHRLSSAGKIVDGKLSYSGNAETE